MRESRQFIREGISSFSLSIRSSFAILQIRTKGLLLDFSLSVPRCPLSTFRLLSVQPREEWRENGKLIPSSVVLQIQMFFPNSPATTHTCSSQSPSILSRFYCYIQQERQGAMSMFTPCYLLHSFLLPSGMPLYRYAASYPSSCWRSFLLFPVFACY